MPQVMDAHLGQPRLQPHPCPHLHDRGVRLSCLSIDEHVVELTLALAREMLAASGVDSDPAVALADGSAMDSWRAMIRAQGGDPTAPLPTARESHVVVAPTSGLLTRLDAMAVGLAAWRLGAGRARKEDPVQAGSGVVWHARPGDAVRAGEPLFTLQGVLLLLLVLM